MPNAGTVRSRELAVHDFHRGTDTHAYETLGVHRSDGQTYLFRFFAPQARSVSVCGDFLTDGAVLMHPVDGEGIWEATVDAEILPEGMRYHFCLETPAGVSVSADPYARRGLWVGEVGSVICTEQTHLWHDSLWLWHRGRAGRHRREMPINLYEVHLGSFATRQGRSNAAGDAYLNYREFGELLARYVSDMGYTHIKLMPLTEHPQDSTHGYLPSGYFAPTARYGTPDDLREMVDCLHRAGVGVVMDFPLGTCVDGTGAVHALDAAIPEVQSFLLSAALFWLREFHLDGLCLVGMRAWGAASEEARSAADGFLRSFCAAVHSEFPDVLLMAGEAVSGEGETGRADFDLVYHPRFATEILRYLHAEPSRRRYLDDRLTLSVSEAIGGGEHVLLPLSHGAVCAGRGSLFEGMQGGYLQKFAGVRLCLAYQMLHPGKKLLFMGCELGQLRTWDDSAPLDWFLSDLELHGRLQRYVRALNHFYREDARLWQMDASPNGLWHVGLFGERGTPSAAFALKRFDAMGRELLAVLNFSADAPLCCRCEVGGRVYRYRECFNTDNTAFGGQGRVAAGGQVTVDADGSLALTVPPMTAVFYEPIAVRAEGEQMSWML